eukprot:6361005-Pyramimonas_sp.AAC.1
MPRVLMIPQPSGSSRQQEVPKELRGCEHRWLPEPRPDPSLARHLPSRDLQVNPCQELEPVRMISHLAALRLGDIAS